MTYILGLSFFFHDSAAAIVCDGELIAAAAEERFSREKHTNDFPSNALAYCIQAAGVCDINDIEAVVYYEKPVAKLFRATQFAVSSWPRGLGTFASRFPDYLVNKVDIRSVIQERLPSFRGEILFSEHHLSHAASAYYCSPFEEAAILTVDGVGEYDTTTIGVGKGQEIEIIESVQFPHSIGLFYSALTAYLGFEVNEGEWKVMGLAPYGHDVYSTQLMEMFKKFSDGSFALNMDYFRHGHSAVGCGFQSSAWEDLLGIAPRNPEDSLAQSHKDLAESGQVVLEELMIGLCRRAKELTGSNNLAMAGGVALNGVANWRLEQAHIFNQIWVQPAAGDDGGAVGAALAVSNMVTQCPRTPELKHVFLGPSFTQEQYKSALTENGLEWEHLETSRLLKIVAQEIANDRVVGWFQGRMEFGPRALGARSILGNPCSGSMKSIINDKIKYRESFRPFAPVVTEDRLTKYFDVPPNMKLPFMVQVVSVKEEFQEALPAVTHEGGTARVQSVNSMDNPLLFRLLKQLETEIGHPIVLNTSFNVRGEPIVCTPEDAIRTFNATGLDLLVLGNYLVRKKSISERSETRLLSEDKLQLGETDKKTSVGEEVLEFYQELPFNVFSDDVVYAARLFKKNIIKKGYPAVDRIIRKDRINSILDVGCGSGWFVNSCGRHYGVRATGIDMNSVVLEQARSVSRIMGTSKNVVFDTDNVFSYDPVERFDFVNSLGVLHHTEDCIGGLKRCLRWVRDGGYVHIGLYNAYMRQPFLKYFEELKLEGLSNSELYQEFVQMVPGMNDTRHSHSWFRDQVLHPHETTHTYREISGVLIQNGFKIIATSLVRSFNDQSIDNMEKREKTVAKKNERYLYKKKRYVPGFFTILAKQGT